MWQSNQQYKKWIFLAVAVLWSCLGDDHGKVQAASNTGSLGVSASVSAKCIFSNGNGPANNQSISFGTYDPINDNATEADNSSGNINVKCTKNTSAQIALDAGQHGSQAVNTTRAMSDGIGDYLSYELFTNSGRSTVWDTTNMVSYTDVGGSFASVTVYASIPPAQNVGAGNYTDTVVMTIYY